MSEVKSLLTSSSPVPLHSVSVAPLSTSPALSETTVTADVHHNNTDISLVSVEEDVDEIVVAEVTTVDNQSILKN